MDSSNLSWADYGSDSDEIPGNFSKVNIDHINDISGDTNEKYLQKEEELINTPVPIISDRTKFPKIIDKPENLNTLFVERKNEYKCRSTIIHSEKKKFNECKDVKKRTRCYTCNPRKKVNDHIIEKKENVTFHHDMCNRSVIVVTPNKHYNSLKNEESLNIGNLFKMVDTFCRDWNIIDYSVSYNQGSWQNHPHFHLKIKTHDSVIKRMRGDHWKRVSIKRLYEKEQTEHHNFISK